MPTSLTLSDACGAAETALGHLPPGFLACNQACKLSPEDIDLLRACIKEARRAIQDNPYLREIWPTPHVIIKAKSEPQLPFVAYTLSKVIDCLGANLLTTNEHGPALAKIRMDLAAVKEIVEKALDAIQRGQREPKPKPPAPLPRPPMLRLPPPTEVVAAPLETPPSPSPSPSPPVIADQSNFPSGDVTIRQVLEWYAANAPHSNSTKGERERRRLYGILAATIGDRYCSLCKPHDLLGFINERAGTNDWTRRRWAATLQRPFNFAVQLGLIKLNPFRGLSFKQGNNGRDWTEAEYQRLLRAAKPHLRRFIVFIRFSGMRPGEIRNLERRNINLERYCIVIEEHKMKFKTKMARRIPLNNVLVKILAWLDRNTPLTARKLFLNAFGSPWKSRSLVRGFEVLRERAGLPDDLKLHGGRHTFATRALLNGVGVGTLSELLGHATITTTQRYVHLAGKTDHLNDAMAQAIQSKRPAKEEGTP